MDTTEATIETADQQLGSPGFTVELGMLSGIVMGVTGLALLGRRHRRRRSVGSEPARRDGV
jgi:hypothetical protein